MGTNEVSFFGQAVGFQAGEENGVEDGFVTFDGVTAGGIDGAEDVVAFALLAVDDADGDLEGFFFVFSFGHEGEGLGEFGLDIFGGEAGNVVVAVEAEIDEAVGLDGEGFGGELGEGRLTEDLDLVGRFDDVAGHRDFLKLARQRSIDDAVLGDLAFLVLLEGRAATAERGDGQAHGQQGCVSECEQWSGRAVMDLLPPCDGRGPAHRCLAESQAESAGATPCAEPPNSEPAFGSASCGGRLEGNSGLTGSDYAGSFGPMTSAAYDGR